MRGRKCKTDGVLLWGKKSRVEIASRGMIRNECWEVFGRQRGVRGLAECSGVDTSVCVVCVCVV